jgi:hypothetical protein
MAKYVEVPRVPAVVQAIQFKGLVDDVPTFNEQTPGWLFSALFRGVVHLRESELAVNDVFVPVESWLVVDWDDALGETLRIVHNGDFNWTYRLARKKPVRRAKVLKVAA